MAVPLVTSPSAGGQNSPVDSLNTPRAVDGSRVHLPEARLRGRLVAHLAGLLQRQLRLASGGPGGHGGLRWKISGTFWHMLRMVNPTDLLIFWRVEDG